MILDTLRAGARARASRLPATFPNPSPRPARSLRGAIRSAQGRGIIGELKFASPSRGRLQDPARAASLADELVDGGCIALSVVTEPAYFAGSPEILTRVRERVPVPVLRKDFILDPRQVYETRALGADAILLIARILGRDLPGYIALSRSLGLEPLVEVHTRADLTLAFTGGADLIGINNRDLRTQEIDLATTLRLAPLCRDRVRIAMSGIAYPSDMDRLRGAVDAFLIGTALMSAEHPRAVLEAFRCA